MGASTFHVTNRRLFGSESAEKLRIVGSNRVAKKAKDDVALTILIAVVLLWKLLCPKVADRKSVV